MGVLRGSMWPLTQSLGAPLPWWRAGGVSAANVVAAYAAKGAASLAASYTNLANPGTYNAAPGVAPTWASGTGWTFNGSTQWLTTGISPNAANYSMILRFSGATATGDRVLAGCTGNGITAFLLEINYTTAKIYYGNGTQINTAGTLTSGVLAVAGANAYKNGVIETGTMSNAGTNRPIPIGAYDDRGTIGFRYAGNIQAVAIYNATLSASQVAAITSAMNLI